MSPETAMMNPTFLTGSQQSPMSPGAVASAAASTIISVVLCYRDRYFNVGLVDLTAPLDLAALKAAVGRISNIPPHELSVSLVRRRRHGEHIDGPTEFSAGGQSLLLVERKRPVLVARGEEVRVRIWGYERRVMRNRPAPRRTGTDVECQGCAEGSGEFHPCVHDRIVEDFRSAAGPVERPEKKKQQQQQHALEEVFNWDPIFHY